MQGDRAELWVPTQDAGSGARQISSLLGIPAANITVHITRSGGAFGRRAYVDYMVEAAAISQKAGVPVKLTWDRTDDLQHDYYGAGGYHFLKGGLDASGKLIAWQNHSIAFGSRGGGRGGGQALQPGTGSGIDGGQFPARSVPNYRNVQSVLDCRIPMGWWRAPGNCAFAFVTQGFVGRRSGGKVMLEPKAVTVVMTHRYLDDVPLLRALIPQPLAYLGLLGSKKRTARLFGELKKDGFTISEEQVTRLHAPVGLDLGAETPEEVALAIVAEIQATLSSRNARSLRERAGSIH